MLPMIMRSLSLPDPELRCNMLEVLTSILEVHDDSADEVLHAQAKSLVERLLVIAIPEEGIPETAAAIVRLAPSFHNPTLTWSCIQRSRAASLRCLGIFPDVIRYDALHPVKSKVIRELGSAVDDAKRVVRREAVDTRSKWYVMSCGLSFKECAEWMFYAGINMADLLHERDSLVAGA